VKAGAVYSQHAAHHRHREVRPLSLDQREDLAYGSPVFPGAKSGRFLDNLPLNPQRLVLTSERRELLTLVGREAVGALALLALGLLDPRLSTKTPVGTAVRSEALLTSGPSSFDESPQVSTKPGASSRGSSTVIAITPGSTPRCRLREVQILGQPGIGADASREAPRATVSAQGRGVDPSASCGAVASPSAAALVFVSGTAQPDGRNFGPLGGYV
jgi:hypothetical protein